MSSYGVHISLLLLITIVISIATTLFGVNEYNVFFAMSIVCMGSVLNLVCFVFVEGEEKHKIHIDYILGVIFITYTAFIIFIICGKILNINEKNILAPFTIALLLSATSFLAIAEITHNERTDLSLYIVATIASVAILTMLVTVIITNVVFVWGAVAIMFLISMLGNIFVSCDIVPRQALRHATHYNAAQYNAAQYNAAQYNAMQRYAMQRNTM